MNYYYYSGENHINPHADSNINILEESGFAGAMFTYSTYQQDPFVQIARDIDLSKKIKYMVAIRPYTISPQYLRKISESINSIMPDRLQINLISGHIKEEEKYFGGILGEVNDLSSSIDRSNYMIDYLIELDKIYQKHSWLHKPDIFVTTTNKYVFQNNIKLKNKMIIPYEQFVQAGWFEKNNDNNSNNAFFDENFKYIEKEVMLYIFPIIREKQKDIDDIDKTNSITGTEYFTYDGFYNFVKNLNFAGIKYLMLYGGPNGEEAKNIINAVKMINSLDTSV